VQFTQRRPLDRLTLVLPPARKRPLPGVRAQLRRPLGQQERRLTGTVAGVNQRDRHRRDLQGRVFVRQARKRGASLRDLFPERRGERIGHVRQPKRGLAG